MAEPYPWANMEWGTALAPSPAPAPPLALSGWTPPYIKTAPFGIGSPQAEDVEPIARHVLNAIGNIATIPQRLIAAHQPPPLSSDEVDNSQERQRYEQAKEAFGLSSMALGTAAPMATRGAVGVLGGKLMAPEAPFGLAPAEWAAPKLEPAGIRAFHGSPHDFERFDISKIGTGEGAQAYGHGLYLAGAEDTAKQYRTKLSSPFNVDTGALKAVVGEGPFTTEHFQAIRNGAADVAVPPEKAAQRIQWRYPELRDKDQFAGSGGPLHNSLTDAVKYARESGRGKMYETAINADPEHFLHWDKPLSEQSPKVQEALGLHLLPQKPTPAETTAVFKKAKELGVPAHTLPEYKALEARMDSANSNAWQKMGILPHNVHTRPEELTGAQLYQALEQGKVGPHQLTDARSPDVAQRLREAGIPGIKYLDQGSRNSTRWIVKHPQGGINDFADEQSARAFLARNPESMLEAPSQSHNYVVFDDKLISILRKYGLAGLTAGGGAAAVAGAPGQAQAAPAFGALGGP